MIMKKARKGLTLVEVVVSIAIIAVISVALVTAYAGIVKVSARQEEYVRLDMVCNDMRAYFDAYGADEWDEKYFPEVTLGDKCRGYLNSRFKPCSLTDEDMKYTITYEVVDDKLNIISIESSSFVYAEDRGD